MELGHQTKQILVVAGIATVTYWLWNFVSHTKIPVIATVAQKITGNIPPA